MVDEKKLNLIFQVFSEIGIISQLSTAQLEMNLPLGLKASQFGVLNHFVRRGERSTPAKLASAFQVTKGAMTNNLNRLLKHRLISIEPDPEDGRVKRVDITAKGRRIHRQSVRSLFVSMQALIDEFGADDFENLLPFLMRLRAYLDEMRD